MTELDAFDGLWATLLQTVTKLRIVRIDDHIFVWRRCMFLVHLFHHFGWLVCLGEGYLHCWYFGCFIIIIIINQILSIVISLVLSNTLRTNTKLRLVLDCLWCFVKDWLLVLDYRWMWRRTIRFLQWLRRLSTWHANKVDLIRIQVDLKMTSLGIVG